MDARLGCKAIGFVLLVVLTTSILIAGCGPALSPQASATAISTRSATAVSASGVSSTSPPVTPSAAVSTATVETVTIEMAAATKAVTSETSWKDFFSADFKDVHSPVNGDDNEHLIFGAIPIATPAPDLAPELAAFLGRWEGYDYSPPVKKDNKGVLVIQEITPEGGRAFLWGATILQFPFWVKEIQFRVVPGAVPAIEWQGNVAGAPNGAGGIATFTFAVDGDRQTLKGGINVPPDKALTGPIELTRKQAFTVYRDYARYFADKRLYPKEFQNSDLLRYGAGYMVYLPEDYETNAQQTWPLILFLCGTGERGENIFLFSKQGPFQMIRGQGPLPFIIVAPMLHVSNDFRSFPETYLDGVLAEIEANYRVDPKRIYLTGLSMGGEATYRYALHRPEVFAAIAPLAGFDPKYVPPTYREGFQPFTVPMERIKDIAVWAIHGTEDTFVPLSVAQKTVDALKQAGGNVRFTVLPDHDHDVWTDTYTDPKFYEWLLEHSRP